MLVELFLITTLSGPFDARYISCYDGDTCRFAVSVWIDQTIETQVRLRGVDTPEIRGLCASERSAAVHARSFIQQLLSTASSIHLSNIEPDKYGGRILADITVDGRSVSESLITNGFARPYYGSTRQTWCGT